MSLLRASQVEELRRDLRIKSQELEVKNAAANDKLKKMVKDQQEAEKKKVRRLILSFKSALMFSDYCCNFLFLVKR